MSKPHLELSSVSMAFPTPKGEFLALDNVNLKLAKGEFVSLIGHSGCGKSTVLNIVAGLLQASKGGCMLDGREVNEPGPERSVVFQNHSLMPWMSAYQNVELAVNQVFKKTMGKQERRDWIVHNLELVHMGHALDKRPEELSGGMRQRVGIARALMQTPDLLLVDEPTASLDPRTSRQIMRLITRLSADRGLPAIINIHDVPLARRYCQRMIGLREGRIVYDGPESSLDDGVLTEIYGEEDWDTQVAQTDSVEEDDAQDSQR